MDWESGSSIDSVRDQIICRRMFADIDEESSAGDEASSNSDDNQLSSDVQMKRFVTFRKKKSEKSLSEFAEKKSCPSSSNRARKYWWSFRFKKRLKNRLRKTNGSKSTPCDLSSADSEISLEAGCMSTCMGVKKADEQVSDSVIWFSGPSSDINDSRSSGDDSPVHTPKVKVKGRSKKSKHRAKDKSSRQMKKLTSDDVNEHLCTACANDSVIEIPPNIPYHSALATGGRESLPSISGNAFQKQCIITTYPSNGSPLHGAAYSSESQISEYGSLTPQGTYIPHTVHTQVDYVHCLVPDLCKISSCTFYWGVMDRYEAEKLLENKPEGTFLLRDSAQEEFLFSVSFRRYARSLHARIEQWNHKFSFDSHDPGVFSSDTVCELIEHYKDPSCCMFFEPMLTLPMNRTFPFPLQHLCRAVIGSHITYDGINFLPLPKKLKEYLRYYHYKQKVRVRRFEVRQ